MLIGKTGLNTIANQVQTQGYGAAHQAAKQTGQNMGVSNFGNETKAGSSKFQQANEQVAQDGEKAVAQKMKDSTQTREAFANKMNYQKNATMAAIRQSTMDIGA